MATVGPAAHPSDPPPGPDGGSAADLDAAVAAWAALGEHVDVGGHRAWTARLGATGEVQAPPLLALHGFPTSSADWRPVLPALRVHRDVVVVDVPGFGLADKPDHRYSLRSAADAVEACARHLGLGEVDLLTHDMGDSVGGELLARSMEGRLAFSVRRRVLTNGSIYIDMAQLTTGQQLLLSLPDERNTDLDEALAERFGDGVEATFAPDHAVAPFDVDLAVALARRDGGLGLLPRTIRYIEDRRAEERRFTGAIEAHPSPVGVVWGRLDPVAVHDMALRFVGERDDALLVTLEGVGHYPMLEAPGPFADAVLDLLDRPEA